jgi:hypothetical protein
MPRKQDTLVKWSMSRQGWVLSRCGRYKIVPLFMGCNTPQAYNLEKDGVKVASVLNSQKEAKEYAEKLESKST